MSAKVMADKRLNIKLKQIAILIREEILPRLRDDWKTRLVLISGLMLGLGIGAILYYRVRLVYLAILLLFVGLAFLARILYQRTFLSIRSDLWAEKQYEQHVVDVVSKLEVSLQELSVLNGRFEDAMIDRFHLVTKGRSACLAQSKDIVLALGKRLSQIKSQRFSRAITLLSQEVEIQRDPLASVLESTEIPPIRPIDCESCLEQMKLVIRRELADLQRAA